MFKSFKLIFVLSILGICQISAEGYAKEHQYVTGQLLQIRGYTCFDILYEQVVYHVCQTENIGSAYFGHTDKRDEFISGQQVQLRLDQKKKFLWLIRPEKKRELKCRIHSKSTETNYRQFNQKMEAPTVNP